MQVAASGRTSFQAVAWLLEIRSGGWWYGFGGGPLRAFGCQAEL
jgi:hypothetical protein